MGENSYCLKRMVQDHALHTSTFVAIGQMWEVGTHLKGWYRHPNTYRRVPETMHHSWETKFHPQVGLRPNCGLDQSTMVH